MTTNPRFLLPKLPPELRNEVYDYLSTPGLTSVATNTGLPIQLKTFASKHTSVQICPVHYGSTGLLALERYRFHEAREYRSWLLNNASELRFGITFDGRVNTFIQEDWDRKIEMHLCKLAKQHPWLRKVAKYNIQIIWNSTDGALKSKRRKRTMGQIPKDMVRTLTVLMDENVKRRNGDINVRLYMEHNIAVENALSATKFGLADFFSTPNGLGGCYRLTQEVWKQPRRKDSQLLRCSPKATTVQPTSEERIVLYTEKGLTNWATEKGGNMLIRQTLRANTELEITVGNLRLDGELGIDFVLMELVEESLGHR
ncbi:hypothetical protein BKA66DRAFT_9560 [Pyrenochaeta sp. MPI-SDFR-AT-0127]|nr:hypothetical protein BKA66DRAFT_9560 [Pyrenochaeta sp. MPI-SDFR-AT-0127]